MSVVKHFIEDSIKKTEIDEFLQNEFERAGYGGVSITKTPLGTHLVIYTMRPGMVIGRGGETIRTLATVLEEKFQLPSPQISVAEIEIPELNAYVVASRISSALKRGVHYRRAGFWGLTQAMEAGALGIEIIISGKLRTDRARYEKFKTGYLPKSGEPPRKYMRTAELHVQLKPGTLGIKVSLLPPDAEFPDQVQVYKVEEEFEPETAGEMVEEKQVAEEKLVEPEVSPVEEQVEVLPESKESPPEEKVESKKETTEPEVPVVEPKVVEEKEAVKEEAKPETEPAAKKETVKTKTASKKPKETKKKSEKKVAEPVASVAKEKAVAKKKTKTAKAKTSATKKAAEEKKPAKPKKKAAPAKKKKAVKKEEAGK